MAKINHKIGRHPIAFAKAWALWMSNPVSERGAANVYQMVYASGGPNLRRMCDAMHDHAIGKRLLRERPDLAARLNDLTSLSRLSPGTIGRQYFEFINGPETIPGYILAGLAYRHGHFDKLEWPEDMKWLVERLGNTHDLAHMLSGYGADLAGEALNINFTLGLVDRPILEAFSFLFALGSAVVLAPSCGTRTWLKLMREAYVRGRSTSQTLPFWCIPFEDLLPLPSDEARQLVGIPPLSNGKFEIDTSGFLTNRISRLIAGGFGAMDRAMVDINHAKQMVAAGLTPRELMSASPKTRKHLDRMRHEGASVTELVEELRARAAS